MLRYLIPTKKNSVGQSAHENYRYALQRSINVMANAIWSRGMSSRRCRRLHNPTTMSVFAWARRWLLLVELGEAPISYSALRILRMVMFSGDRGGRKQEEARAAHATRCRVQGEGLFVLGPAPRDMWPWTRANAIVANDRRKERGLNFLYCFCQNA